MIVGGRGLNEKRRAPNSEWSIAISLLPHVGAVKLRRTRQADYPRFMKSRPDGASGSLLPHCPSYASSCPGCRRYYGRRRKLFRQARPDFCDIGLNRRVSASFPVAQRRETPRVGITPRENARPPIRDTLGRTRNFAGRHGDPTLPSIFPEREITIPRSSPKSRDLG